MKPVTARIHPETSSAKSVTAHAKLLNTWAEMREAGDGSWVTRICLELTAEPAQSQISPVTRLPNGDYDLRIVLAGTSLVMAEDDILVADGLLRKVGVSDGGDGTVELRVILEHPATPTRDDIPGLPHTTRFTFPRDGVRDVFRGKRIGIDPGHGGKDFGIRGPVNLLEKDTSLAVALELRDLLSTAGATPILTRDRDIPLSDADRVSILREAGAELCVQIHACGVDDPLVQLYRIFEKPECAASAILGRKLTEAFFERMGMRLMDSGPLEPSESMPCPTVRVEPLCLTYFSDEANFRAPLFRKRTAQAIFNGIHRFLRQR